MMERIDMDKEIQDYHKAKRAKNLAQKKMNKLQLELEQLEDEKFAQDDEITSLRLKLKSLSDLDDRFLETLSKNQKLEIELENVRLKNEGIYREIEVLEIGQRDLMEELVELKDRKKSPPKVYCQKCQKLKTQLSGILSPMKKPSKPEINKKSLSKVYCQDCQKSKTQLIPSLMKKPSKLEIKKSESEDSVYFDAENEAVNEINKPNIQDFNTLEPCVIGQVQPNGNSKQKDCITAQLDDLIQVENRREKLSESAKKSMKFPACPELNNLSMVDSTIKAFLSSYFLKK